MSGAVVHRSRRTQAAPSSDGSNRCDSVHADFSTSLEVWLTKSGLMRLLEPDEAYADECARVVSSWRFGIGEVVALDVGGGA